MRPEALGRGVVVEQVVTFRVLACRGYPPLQRLMAFTYRVAHVEDVPELMAIRNAVRENALVHTVLTIDDYVRAMTVDGRAWVCEDGGRVVGFSCGRLTQSDVWALFLRESHEGRGIGSALMDIVERWMFEEGCAELRLVTAPGTRAERLYRRRSWEPVGTSPSGEVELVLTRERWTAARQHA